MRLTATRVSRPPGTATPLLPGIALPGRPAADRPDRLVAEGTLLLSGAVPGHQVGWFDHRRRWEPIAFTDRDTLVEIARASGLVGMGGAGFPTHLKLKSVSGRHVGPVVVNATEGEPAGAKDGVLLRHVPHLVLDGAGITASALGTRQVVVRLSNDRRASIAAVELAIAQRPRGKVNFEVSIGPSVFVAGEASAVVRALSGGPALPAHLGLPPTIPSRWTRRKRPVLLSNVETFARLAVAVRGLDPTSSLVTVSGAVGDPGVAEVHPNRAIADLLDLVGGPTEVPGLLISGGWHGRWVPWSGAVASALVNRESIEAVGGRWGAGVLILIPDSVSQLDLLGAVTRQLARDSAGQCGPCVNGLSDIANRVASESRTRAGNPAALIQDPQFQTLLGSTGGRGLCAHPAAAVAAIRSALSVGAADSDTHVPDARYLT